MKLVCFLRYTAILPLKRISRLAFMLEMLFLHYEVLTELHILRRLLSLSKDHAIAEMVSSQLICKTFIELLDVCKIQGVLFIVSPSIGAVSYGKPASVATSRGSCRSYGHDKRDVLLQAGPNAFVGRVCDTRVYLSPLFSSSVIPA